MRLLPEELENTIKQGERQTVDFKESRILSDPLKLAKLMVAFANNLHASAKHGGLILLGVKNDGSLEGMKAKQRHEEHLMNIARDKCEPSIKPQFETISLAGGDVYVLTIPKMTTYPHAVKLQDGNIYYVRVGTTVRVATPEELRELFVGTGRLTISQVIQRVRESVPPLSQPYRSVLIAPEYVIKNLVQFNEETEHWLRRISDNLDLVIGDARSTQNGIIFRFEKATVHEYFAKVTGEGVIYYREHIPYENGGIHIGRTIKVIGDMLEYARSVYERFKYAGACIIKFELGNIRNMRLTTDPSRFLRGNYTFDEDKVLIIEQETPWARIMQYPASVVESVVIEFCRSFGFSITEKAAKEYVTSILKK